MKTIEKKLMSRLIKKLGKVLQSLQEKPMSREISRNKEKFMENMQQILILKQSNHELTCIQMQIDK